MLNRIMEIGRAERIGPGQVMPSLKVSDWNFASRSAPSTHFMSWADDVGVPRRLTQPGRRR
jgi:hypothetical protein